jgi:hypothetical protein
MKKNRHRRPTDLLTVRRMPDGQGTHLRLEPGPSYAEFNAGTEPQYVVCAPATAPPAVPSTRGQCRVCAAEVWVASSTRMAMAQMRDPRLLCLDCMVAKMEEEQAGAD